MKSIELYKMYLKNSTVGVNLNNKIKKLQYEATQIKEIVNEVERLWEDKSLFDKKDHSIYTLIKREIYVSSCNGSQDGVIQLARFLLDELVAQIEGDMQKLAAQYKNPTPSNFNGLWGGILFGVWRRIGLWGRLVFRGIVS